LCKSSLFDIHIRYIKFGKFLRNLKCVSFVVVIIKIEDNHQMIALHYPGLEFLLILLTVDLFSVFVTILFHALPLLSLRFIYESDQLLGGFRDADSVCRFHNFVFEVAFINAKLCQIF